MENNKDRLKSWGFFLAGLGILLMGIAILLIVIKCPARCKMKDFFRSSCASTGIKTLYSSNSSSPCPITSSKKIEFTDEEFEKLYEEFIKDLEVEEIPKQFIKPLYSEEFKEKMRKSLEGAPLKLISQKIRKIN